MSKMYVATIMDRIVLGDDNYVFVVSHPAIGTIDEETKIFTDRNGSEYGKMLDPSLLMSEIPRAYYNLQELDGLKEAMHAKSKRDAIADYSFYASRFLYYVTRNQDNQVYVEYIDLDKMKGRFKEVLGSLISCSGEENANGTFFINTGNDSSTNKCSIESDGDEDEELDDEEIESLPYHGITSSEIRSDIASLFLEISEGVYSLEDLKNILENVSTQREDLEDLIMSLELQIEASEKGESAIKLREEKAEKRLLESLSSEEKEKRKMTSKVNGYIDLDELYKKIIKTLIAQDEPTLRVITEIARKEQCPSSKNRALLITGPTGCGKTKMMQLIAKYLDRPFYKVDTSQLTVPGYIGKNIEEELFDLYVRCGRDKKKAESAIIFFDEIDKKGSDDKSDVSGRGVLNLLLPFIEGATYKACDNVKKQDEVVDINTRNMIVIFGGAFTDVYKNLKDKGSIGFGSKEVGVQTRKATVADFVDKAKIPDEFMGRVSIIQLNSLDVDAIKRILHESDESAIKVQQKLFEELGVKLTFTDDYIDEIASQAVKRETGARGLNTVVDETTWRAYNDCYMHLGDYEEIILNSDTCRNPEKYQKVLKKV